MKKVKIEKNYLIVFISISLIALVGLFIFTISTFYKTKPGERKSPIAPTPTMQPEKTIIFTNKGVEPEKVEVAKGSRVIWMNKSGKTISLNSNDHPTHKKNLLLNFGNIKDGSAAFLVFEEPGEYGFHNHLIPSQKGIVIVK